MKPHTTGTESGSPSVNAPGDPARWTPRLWVSFLAMVVMLELLASSYIMLSVALPSISRQFSTNRGVWLFTAFLLVATASSPIVGKLADTHSKRRVMLWCVGISALGSALAAIAPNFGFLIAGWSLAGLLSPYLFLVYSLIRDVHPPADGADGRKHLDHRDGTRRHPGAHRRRTARRCTPMRGSRSPSASVVSWRWPARLSR